MRVSTSMFFSKNLDNVLRQQNEILNLQSQMSNGVRVAKASDDPFAKTTFLASNEALQMTNQFQRNIDYAQSRGTLIDKSIGSLTDVMSNVKERMIQAANDTLSAADRKNIAAELRVNLQQMLNTINVRDETGRYVFSGITDNVEAFAVPGDPLNNDPEVLKDLYKFTGSRTVNELQISREIKIPLDVSGYDLMTLDDGTPATSYFSLLQQTINVLEGNPFGDPPAVKTAKQALDTFGADMDKIYDQLLVGRTRVGARLRQIEETQLANLTLAVQYEKTGGNAVGVDFTKSVSEIARMQLSLEASQRAYSSFSKLSIFNFL